jgi:LEA14-like dessication related protein
MKKIIIWILVLTSCLLLTGCWQLQAPEISYSNTDVRLVSFQDVQAISNFQINNPNLIPLKGVVDYTLQINGRDFFSGTSSEISGDSQKQSSFTISNDISLPKIFDSLSALLAELNQGKTQVPYSLKGVYRTTISGVVLNAPLQAQGAIPLPALPSIKLNSIAIDKYDLRKPTFKIAATLTNKNKVPLKLDSAGYKLLGNNSVLGQTSLAEPLSIAANGTQNVVLTTTLDLSSLDAALVQKILNKTAAFDLQQVIQNIN